MPHPVRIPFTRIHVGRFPFLLISILLLFVLQPFLAGNAHISKLIDIFFSAILISGVYAVSQKRGVFIIALIIAFFALTLRWSSHVLNITSLTLWSDIIISFFLALAMVVILAYVFRQEEITSDVILGAICVYFLMGLLWAFVYSILESLQPVAFQLTGTSDTNAFHFTYYSFVTLTTLGYGDITPLSSPARSLSLLEAAMGQLYLAVMIARLVGLNISQSMKKKS